MPPRSAMKKKLPAKSPSEPSDPLPPAAFAAATAAAVEPESAEQEPKPSSAEMAVPVSQPEGTEPVDEVEGEEEEEVEEEWEEVEEEEEEEMEVEVEEAQEEEAREVPEPVKQKRKIREFEVFVGGLPRDATEEDLTEVFKNVGEVVEVRLVKDALTNNNKGFAFVRFATVEQAKQAITELKHVQVKGKTCGVIRSNDNETLHLGNICTTWSKDDLITKLKSFDLENLEEVHLVDDPKNKGKNRGYAFLDFSTHMDAVAALTKLQKRVVFFGADVKAEVSFSRTVEPDEEVMAQVKSVFLDGLPATWDEPQVLEHFKKFGEIENVQLARNMPTAKRNDFGFISFATRQAALDCIEVVNKDGVGEGSGKVFVKATLKKPLPKRNPPVLGVRRGYIGKDFGMRRPSSLFARPYPERFGGSRGFVSRPRGRGRFSSTVREVGSPPSGRFGARSREGYVRDIPSYTSSRSRDSYVRSSRSRDPFMRSSRSRDPYVPSSRSRDPYMQSSISSGRRAVGSHTDDIYDARFEPLDTYEYPAESGYKRSYTALDYDMLATSSTMRPVRSRQALETSVYPRTRDSVYDEYSRFPPGERFDYGRTEFDAGRGYGNRFSPPSGATRKYY